jgi:hypothetical protein
MLRAFLAKARPRAQDDEEIIAALIAGLDLDGLDRVLTEGRAELSSHENRVKYLAFEDVFRKLLPHLKAAGLHASRPRRILDIGAGPGRFAYLCRYFGHRCVGLDLPAHPYLAAMRQWFGAECVEHRIHAGRPLPTFLRRFHLATALHVQFNKKRRGGVKQLWEIEDWSFFLDDLRDNVLVRGGSFLLKLNTEYKIDGPRFESPELQSFFAERGGQPSVERAIYFPTLR